MPKRKRDTAATICDAARLEFAEYGFAGARMARIAARAGVNKQLLFYYFGSKAGLYRAVMEIAQRDVAASLETPRAPTDSADRLRAEIAQLFQALAARPDLVRLMLHEAQQSDGSRAAVEVPIRRIVHRIREIVSEGQGLGFFRDNVDPDVAAEQALILTLGYVGLEPVLPGKSTARRSAWPDAVADLMNRGLSW